MKSHRIDVTVDSDSIRVEPDTLIMNANEEVQWLGSNLKKFSIEFDGTGPFAARALAHEQAVGLNRPQARGRFKYTVISTDNPGLRLDPVIIVEDPPSQPNP